MAIEATTDVRLVVDAAASSVVRELLRLDVAEPMVSLALAVKLAVDEV